MCVCLHTHTHTCTHVLPKVSLKCEPLSFSGLKRSQRKCGKSKKDESSFNTEDRGHKEPRQPVACSPQRREELSGGQRRAGKQDFSGLLLPRLQIFRVRSRELHSHCFYSSKDESETK